MTKGEDFGNGCTGDGFCFAKRMCEHDCDPDGECTCGYRHAVVKYIRHEECPHKCELIKCKCGEHVPQYELDDNDGICNVCFG